MALFEADPDADFAADLAVQSSMLAQRPEAALRYYAMGDTTTAWGREWRWGDNMAINALHMLGRFEEELALARKARAEDPSDYGHLAREARALTALGRTEELEQSIAEGYALESPPTAPGQLMRDIAKDLRHHGRGAESKAMAERQLTWIEGLSDERRHDRTAADLMGDALDVLGRHAELRDLHLARVREPEKWPRAGWTDAQLRELYTVSAMVSSVRLGDTVGALTMIEELRTPTSARALVLYEAPAGRAFSLEWAAVLMAGLDRKAEAVALIREWLNHGGRLYEPDEALLPRWESLRDYPPFQELMRLKG